jgi:hypothetical protein
MDVAPNAAAQMIAAGTVRGERAFTIDNTKSLPKPLAEDDAPFRRCGELTSQYFFG